VALTLGDILRRNAAVAPQHPAFVFRHGGERHVVTYGELDQRTNQVAHALVRGGATKGDRVAVLMRNNADIPIVMWGAVRAGCIAMPLNFRYTAVELAGLLARGTPRVLVVEPDYAGVATEAIARMRGGAPQLLRTAELWDLAAGEPTDALTVIIDEHDPHVLLCTSGTTGPAKGVLQSHRSYFLQTGNPVFSARGTGESDVGLCCYQLFHSSGWRTCMIYWRARATVVFLRRPEPHDVLAAIEDEHVTQLAAVPETLRALVDMPELTTRDLSSVVAVNTGTSPLVGDDIAAFAARFPGAGVRIHYGASEAGPVTSLGEHESAARPTSVGRPTLHVDVRIVDADDRDVPRGAVGEVIVRSEFLMSGYRGDPEATAQVLRDGWYHMGDLGYLDDEGYLFITGRVKDVIRSGGESVFPAEVEACLRDLDGVLDCAVVGVPDPAWGEAVGVAIVRGNELSRADVDAHVHARLARFKHPRHVIFLDALPRTEALGKVERATVRALILAASAPDRAEP
jgi:acyl-CoA synthetase (AMP-forming)/AMP-acid ligase II